MRKLRLRKAAGPDGVIGEHLKWGGNVVQEWLLRVTNAVVDLEVVPSVLKSGVIVPVYKGGGKDPMDVNSYRGVALTSVVGKVLEFLILERLQVVLLEAGIPHINQSAYKKGVSCADAIFATQEAIARYLRDGSKVYMCLFDLQKAFDSIEYPVLLSHLYKVGINGKLWRILRNWYSGTECKVRVEGHCSESFRMEQGVRQGSVLSPVLFLVVMDPFLRQLEESGMGLSVNSFYAGGFLHADDIRTLASNVSSMEEQVAMVQDFARQNLLRLNVQKCEIVVFSRSKMKQFPECSIDRELIPAGDVGKCLGYWWREDLMAIRAVEENIKKARKSFFLYGGIGVFLGDLSPLSSRSVVEVCVMPILLYGCENWIVSEKLLRQLESFQGEMGKRILGLPRCTSNTAVGIVLGWPSVHARILVRKLCFLKRLVSGDGSKLGSRMLRSLADDTETVSLVRECRELEEAFGASFTDRIQEAREGEGPHPREIKKEIMGRDQAQRMDRCSQEDRVLVFKQFYLACTFII